MSASSQSLRILSSSAEFKRLKKRIAILEERLKSKAIESNRQKSKSSTKPT